MLIFHIGLHKTATSSLQRHIFPYLEGIHYLGRNIDDTKASSAIYHSLSDYCFGLKSSLQREQKLRNALNSLEAKHGTLLLSEEWFTSDYSGQYGLNGTTWQEKLNKLSRIISALDHKILVSIRRPQELLYSQYCEFNKVGVQGKYPRFIDYAMTSNDANALDLEALDQRLKYKFNLVRYLPFDSISRGWAGEFLAEFFNVTTVPAIPHDNRSRKEESGVIIETENPLLKSLVSALPASLVKRFKSNSSVNAFANTLSNATKKQSKIPFPSEPEKQLLDAKFESSNNFYSYLCSNSDLDACDE